MTNADRRPAPPGWARTLLSLSLCFFLAPLLAWESALRSDSDQAGAIALAAFFTAAIGYVLLVTIFAGPLIAGRNRSRMAAVFGPWLRATLILLGISTLAQAALVDWTLLTLWPSQRGLSYLGFLAAVGLAGLFAGSVLLQAGLSFFGKHPPMMVKGVVLDRASQPGFFAFIDDIASRLGARPPDHVIAGLEPTFFVTSGSVRLVGRPDALAGSSLFVSLSLMRLLDAREFASIVGHEFGHFVGEDLAYSTRFAPMYQRVGATFEALSQTSNHWVFDLARKPSLIALRACIAQFVTAERAVGRERELVADQAGIRVTDSRTFATALVKVSLLGPLWGQLVKAHIDELDHGRSFRNLSAVYGDLCADCVARLDWPAVRAELGRSLQPHPVDSHPPLQQRLQSAGESLERLSATQLAGADRSARAVLDQAEGLEEALSALEAQWLLHVGAASLPKSAQS